MTALWSTSNNVVNESTTSWPFRRNYRQTMETKGRTMIHHKIEWMNTQWENHETLGLNLKQLLILWTNCKQFVLFYYCKQFVNNLYYYIEKYHEILCVILSFFHSYWTKNYIKHQVKHSKMISTFELN